MTDYVADMPDDLASVIDTLEKREPEIADSLRAIWQHPDQYAGGSDELQLPAAGSERFMLMRTGIIFGMALEQAYPADERGSGGGD